jgi:hypothetical protein
MTRDEIVSEHSYFDCGKSYAVVNIKWHKGFSVYISDLVGRKLSGNILEDFNINWTEYFYGHALSISQKLFKTNDDIIMTLGRSNGYITTINFTNPERFTGLDCIRFTQFYKKIKELYNKFDSIEFQTEFVKGWFGLE